MTTPNTAKVKNSQEPNSSASLPMIGEKIARQINPKRVPIADEIVASPMASPALPALANGFPSRHVAAFAGVPGMLRRMADQVPPYIAAA